MKRKILLTLSIFAIAINGKSQTAAEKCLNSVNTPSYVNCGNNAAFNMSGEFTIEAWINPFTFGDDRKLIGKTNNSFNSGFVFGLENGIYTEIWQPARTELKAGTLPSFYSWVHVAITFKPGGEIKGYINGKLEGAASVGSSNLATNTEDLIIGIAPWDFGALMFLGEMDEIRFWNVERSAADIQADLYKQLTGSESNLIGLYNLNEGSGSSAGNSTVVTGIDGTITGSGWNSSYAVIGSSTMHTQSDVKAIWLGMNNSSVNDLRVANTTNGLSVITTVDSTNFLLFGHDGGSDVTTTGLSQVATDANFERNSRLWYFETEKTGDDFKSQFAFDLTNAAGGGTALSDSKNTENYTLFHRSGSTGDFAPVVSATIVSAGKVIFDSVNVESGYYTIGVGDSSLVPNGTGGTKKIENNISNLVKIYPNPAKNTLFINLTKAKNSSITIFNSFGKIVKSTISNELINTINIENLANGIYLVKVEIDNESMIKRIIIE